MTSRMLSLALVLLLVSGCGSDSSKPGSPAAPAAAGGVSGDDQPALTMQLVAVLTTVKDADSAKAARPKAEALADKIHAIMEQAKSGTLKISDPEDYGKRMGVAMEAYVAELSRISNTPEAAKELQGMIKKLTP